MEALTPFRLVGNVCAEVPISFTMLYEQPVLMVATGRTFQLYRGNELSLLRGGPTFEKRVRAVTHTSKYRFAAEGGNIHAFSHHKPMWTQAHTPIINSKVSLLCARDDLLFSVGEDKTIVVWEIRSGDRLQTIPIRGSETPTCIAFADGYNNKLLIGTIEGSVHLYNYQTGAFLFSSRKETGSATVADPRIPTANPQILCLSCSKYRDIIVYGTSSGEVVVYNYRTDKVVVSFQHKDTSVTSVAFRGDVEGQVISGTTHGEIAVWDVQERTLHGLISRTKQVRSRDEVLDSPHTASVHTLIWYPGTEVLVSAGGDNALLQFRFDTIDGLGLLVRERRGHMGSCTASHFFNSDLVVTAGADQALRVTHVFSDRASWELSQGKIGKRQRDTLQSRDLIKLSPATALASSTHRNYQWSSLVSIHDCSTQLCGWRMDTRALEVKLAGISTTMHTSRCVTVSQCGNFALVGYSSGHLVSIHLQNKSIRHFLQHDKTASRMNESGVGGVGGGHARDANKTAHEGSVEAVQVCKGNTVVASCGTDGNMILWDLLSSDLIRIINLGIAVTSTSSCLHPESSFMMVGCIDFTIRAFSCDPDVADGTPLRCLAGHSSSITAMAITPDTFQHLVSASSDSALMVWDLAAGVCVGAYRTLSPALSLSFHPDSLFMLSCHAGERGAFLWTNNLRYGFAPEYVDAPEKMDVEALPLLHYPLAHTEDADLDAAAVTAEARKVKEGAGKVISATGDSNMVKMSSNQHEVNLGKLERDEDSDEETVSGKKSKKDRARGIKEGVELFDAKKDVALMLKARQEATQKRLNSIPEENRIVLSGVATSVWSTITMLDAIKQRNQPILPPKKHTLPFFLPSTQDLRPSFVVLLEEDEKKKDGAASGVVDTSSLSPWHRILYSTASNILSSAASPVSADAAKAYETCMRYFKDRNSNAAEIDMEVKRTIDMDEDMLIKSEDIKKEMAKTLVVQRLAAGGKDVSTAAGAAIPTKAATTSTSNSSSSKKKGGKKGGVDEEEKKVVDGDLLLGTSDGYTDGEVYDSIIRLSMLFRFIAHHIATGKDSDLAQGILGAALKTHGSIATYLASLPMDGLVLTPILPDEDSDKTQHKQLLVRIGATKPTATSTPNPLAVAMEKCLDAQEVFKGSVDHLTGLPQALVSVFTMSYS